MRYLSDSEMQVVSGGFFPPIPPIPWCCVYSAGAATFGMVTLAASAVSAGILKVYYLGSDLLKYPYPEADVSDMSPEEAYDFGFKNALAWCATFK